MDVDKVQFSILSEEQIRNYSVLEVTSPDLYEKNNPKVGGLADLRLGTIDRHYKCMTCKGDIIKCPGHFGHIELCKPVYHIGYIKHVVKLLNMVCVNCSNLLCGDVKVNIKNIDKFKYLHDKCKTVKQCAFCNHLQPKFILEKDYKIYYIIDDKKEVISAEDVYYIFRKITNPNLFGMDKTFGHPKDLIIKNLLIPPLHVRPSVMMESVIKSQDDLTHKLIEIIKTNNNLKKQINPGMIKEFSNLLQFHINTYIDNEIPGHLQATHRTGRTIKGICQRLKAKEGRIRGNLMGKRVDFSARTVITAEPNIDLDELGVPEEIAKTLTYPDRVTEYNKEYLQNLVYEGPNATKGARYVISNGMKKDLRFCKPKIQVGDIVERHMHDGDYVVFNRQPTLHKMSMMGHKVKIMKGSTFRMNLSTTTPYNADFDGDEMNLHLPQSETARAEVASLMMVGDNVVSGQSNRPVMGIIQDSLISAYKMTSNDVFLTKSQVMNIMMKIKYIKYTLPPPTIYKPVQLWTGKQIFNLIFPKDLNYNKNITISDGYFCDGRFTKKVLGTSEKSLIHLIWLNYGSKFTVKFMSNIQYICNYWIFHNGFTVGIGDTITSKNVQNDVKNTIFDSEKKVNQFISVAKHNNREELFETKINQVLNNAMAVSGRIVQENISSKNNIFNMVESGSKGSVINIGQIMGVVGQQNVSGGRITLGYKNRTLCHFEPNDINPAPKGFVKTSYYKGLEPHEFFYHAMGGREGIIDTAVKTADTGYIQRRLIKSMEDLKISNDLSLRNSTGDIVQFMYGSDGYNPVYISKQEYTIPEYNSEEFEKLFDKREIENIKSFNIQGHVIYRGPLELTLTKYKNISEIPLDFDNWKDNINKLHEKLVNNWKENNQISMKCLILHIYFELRYKKMKWVSDFEEIIEDLIDKIDKAYICDGEMMGTVAAQSLGEPTTQLTLNSFHFSGISAKNITLGVPRFKELINVLKNLKTPTMSIYSDNLEKLANELESCYIHNILSFIEYCNIDEIEQEILSEKDFFDTCIKLNIDRKKLLEYNITLLDVVLSITKQQKYYTISSNDLIEQPYIYILCSNDLDISENEFIEKMTHDLQNRMNIKGYDEISKCYINENCIETDGTCLKKLFCHDNIVHEKTYSNFPSEILDVLGIEAARTLLIKEIKKVLEFDGGYVDNRHFTTLVDTMTYKGTLMSITRHGINKNDTGPLMRCSFEETVDVLTDASIYSESDNLSGVSESIILGKLSNIGTGITEIILKEESENREEIKLHSNNIQNNSTSEWIESFYPNEISFYE